MILKSRDEIPALLNKRNYKIGLELGVARGEFSHLLLEKSNLSMLISVDRWAGDRGHDIFEYFDVAMRLNKFGKRSLVLRMLSMKHFSYSKMSLLTLFILMAMPDWNLTSKKRQ